MRATRQPSASSNCCCERGAKVSYHDPYVSRFAIGGDVFFKEHRDLISQPLTEAMLEKSDCVILVTGHRAIDYTYVVQHARSIVDTCNATEFVRKGREKITRLGTGQA